MWRATLIGLAVLIIDSLQPCLAQTDDVDRNDALDIGSRRELMVDDYLIDSMQGAATRRLHHPVRRGIAVVHDAAWEGNGGGYHTVFYDPDFKETGRYRMYYHAWHIPSNGRQDHPLYIGYCESEDGIHWVKPELGLVEFNGSKANNIVMATRNEGVMGGICMNRDR